MKYLTYEKAEHIGIVKFSRKDVLNALNRGLLEEFDLFLEVIAKGQQIQALVISGEGDKAFSAGADISEMEGLSQVEMMRFLELGSKVANALTNAPFITIAAVNGLALGGGFEMALACDFIYASKNATFGLPEVHLGLIPSFGGTQRLTEAIGQRLSKELILKGQSITAKEALDLKIVNRVVESSDLLLEACKAGAEIIRNPFLAVQEAKKAINLASNLDQKSLESERNMSALCFGTEERAAKMKEFISKNSHHAAK